MVFPYLLNLLSYFPFSVLSICILDNLHIVLVLFLLHEVLSSTNTSVTVSADFVLGEFFFPLYVL